MYQKLLNCFLLWTKPTVNNYSEHHILVFTMG